MRDDPSCLIPQPDDDKKTKKDRGTHAMELCNLTLQTTLFEAFFDPNSCEICFKREWVLAKKPKLDDHANPISDFRSTWSAGYFLHSLKKRGISWPESNLALDELESLRQAASRERQRSLNSKTPSLKRSESVTEHLAMRLVDLKDISKQMLKRAKQAENEFVDKLRKLVARVGGRLDEEQERVMDQDLLYKKLIAKLENLLEQNYNTPSYVPSVKEIHATIADCLRCTVIFPVGKYIKGVMEVEKHYALDDVATDKCNTFSK